ncbi:MAG TPA: pyridoxal phosphate-dependent aminotransferase [Thermoanaerobaculia bacterium]|nr:pyridoxal phosphate-dependent aminotransferase [Thermoanaerobaculia bacterium]
MTRSRAPYMEWAKSRPKPAVDLAGSNLAACSLEDLPGSREALDLAGESPDGYAPLVAAIAARHGVAPDRVATATGCSGANFFACAALLEPGDEVLVESPFYDPLPAAARLLGAEARTFARRFENAWRLDADAVAAALTPRTRMILVSNPHNPTGTLAPQADIAALGALAAARGITVLVDEVYRDTVLVDRPPPATTVSDTFVSTSSLTKAYGLASLRCGWAIASPDLVRRMRRVRDVVDVWAPIPSDRLSVVAFQNLDALAARARALIEANGQLVRAWLAGRSELLCAPFHSTLAFPRFRDARAAESFPERLLAATGTAVAPGRFFGAPEHFRLAFGGPTDTVTEGLASISRFLDARSA